MAQKVSVELLDDLDGHAADETVTFALDGVNYEIDLSQRNAAKLRKALDGFVASGRRVGGKRQPRKRSSIAQDRSNVRADNRTIREWAKSNGYDVPARGRIPQEVVTAYEAAEKARR